MPNTSAQQAARATTHGLTTAANRSTYNLCKYLWENAPELLCNEWCADLHLFVRGVIAEAGPRPHRFTHLRPVVEGTMIGPGNVQWVWVNAPVTKRVTKQIERGEVPDCVCDRSGQLACATSSSPCTWLQRKVLTALWEA